MQIYPPKVLQCRYTVFYIIYIYIYTNTKTYIYNYIYILYYMYFFNISILYINCPTLVPWQPPHKNHMYLFWESGTDAARVQSIQRVAWAWIVETFVLLGWFNVSIKLDMILPNLVGYNMFSTFWCSIVVSFCCENLREYWNCSPKNDVFGVGMFLPGCEGNSCSFDSIIMRVFLTFTVMDGDGRKG